jgi:hypothetical protein
LIGFGGLQGEKFDHWRRGLMSINENSVILGMIQQQGLKWRGVSGGHCPAAIAPG